MVGGKKKKRNIRHMKDFRRYDSHNLAPIRLSHR